MIVVFNRITIAVALWALLPIAVAAEGPATPPAAALRAYGGGQSYERLFQDTVMPATCAIVLERARCVDDLHVVESVAGPREGVRDGRKMVRNWRCCAASPELGRILRPGENGSPIPFMRGGTRPALFQ